MGNTRLVSDVLKEFTLVPAIVELETFTDISPLVLCLLYFKPHGNSTSLSFEFSIQKHSSTFNTSYLLEDIGFNRFNNIILFSYAENIAHIFVVI
jgi:hypothetical protein